MKISFLSPIYNSSEWLEQMLDSIPKEYAYEIILCDDCSTDNSVEIIKKYMEKCPQIKLLQNETNMKCSYSYNRCIDEATGDYIAVIDSDDYYLPEIRDVLKQVDGTYDIYYYNMIQKDGKTRVPYDCGRPNWSGEFKIIKRSFLGDSRWGREGMGDFDLAVELFKKNPKCLYTNIFAYYYNFPRENSVSAQFCEAMGIKHE